MKQDDRKRSSEPRPPSKLSREELEKIIGGNDTPSLQHYDNIHNTYDTYP